MLTKGILEKAKNFVFVGEAGSGKSEVSINFAKWLKTIDGSKEVDYFDMDMTKPLFRSRDVRQALSGITFHYQDQFMDAPTLVGGVNRALKDNDRYVIMDVGGDYIGARSIGGFAPLLNQENTTVYYILNAFRPWSYDIDHIDHTLGQILHVSHIELNKLRMVNNSNNGPTTTIEEVIEARRKLSEIINPYATIDFTCAKRSLYDKLIDSWEGLLFPLDLHLEYPWSPTFS